MTAIGLGFKDPSLYELRGNLLKMTVNEVQDYLQQIKKVWNDTGCTLMADGWTNQKQQSIINFLVYCPKGTMFLKSVDTSGLRKDAETLFNIFDEVVQEIGVENLVQFITDNDASYKAAGKKLQQKYGSFYWSPCAAHCIDLMLENFSDPRYFPLIDDTIKKAKKITKFIYNHGWVLALMRQEFTKGHDLCRPAITSEPLVRVLRLVDGDEKPAMGYLYDAMERAKENIKARCNNKMALDPDDQDKIIKELDSYNNAVGEFGHALAIRQRDKLNPVAWWTQFGCEVPTLQRFAVRVLSQCCSATGCERNWSTFDFIHSKKRNRLVHKRLNDLVFVRYNLKLRERSIKKGRDALNPINLENIDLMEEWVSEESELLDGEDWDWASIEEPLISLNEEDVDNYDNWVDGGPIGGHFLVLERPLLRVKECRLDNGCDTSLLERLAGQQKAQELFQFLATRKDGQDILIWMRENNGNFNTKNAWDCIHVRAPSSPWGPYERFKSRTLYW
ncbi:uncharacterized protein LOC122307475 [Carya illinoinensis]|uniref:uncharacterized protein LOC122307475 n=1 Tax=Carya illinoinensis TaxID=32201 RepID=UPI001C7296B4|nr:uncharacterized protein LOC122307475 [Carya illinoinensis]